MVSWLRRRLGVHFYYVLVHPLRARPPLAAPPAGLACRVLEGSDLLDHCADPELDLREPAVRAALAAGDVCVGALEESRLAGYVWYSFAGAPHADGVRVQVGPRLRYAYKVHVRPACRGRGIARALLARGAELCPRRGRELGVCFVAPDNAPSLRAFAAAGWRRAGYAGYVKWRGRFRAFASAGTARAGAGFSCA
ncbi:MAG TPA: GNAT family N-acetyltransferase [Burkholderiales bacterium]|nr:GNAT family N-acetyltransferase [Burkholderiales bacterium]